MTMQQASKMFDIIFIGHMCYDEIIPYQGEPIVAPGSAVLCGALAAARVGKKVAVITRLSRRDDHILEQMRQNGIEVVVIPTEDTTYMKVVHATPDLDERQIYQMVNAGYFSLADMPAISGRQVHLAGITDQEFELNFISGIKAMGYSLSTDMQSFVRQVDPQTHEITFRDVPRKVEIIRQMSLIKLDVLEAKILTGTDDLEQAALIVEDWGCPEIMITRSDGVLVRADGKNYFEKFSNRSSIGRTGRGDTTFAAYLSRRSEFDVPESLKFAAALVSIKMESPGPFHGTLEEVLTRMHTKQIDV
jgi:sugar/nucleoside kinase (ribokinase family)